jgi:hypothetical protein
VLSSTLVQVSSAVHDVIINPDVGSRNVTEWAKKSACWHRVQALTIELPKAFIRGLLDPSEYKAAAKDATHIQKIDNGIEAQKKVVELGADFWLSASSWAKSQRLLTQKDYEIMARASAIPSRIPTERQCLYLVAILEKLEEEGCPLLHKALG